MLWRKWNRQWMTLDEDGEALRWYRSENRDGGDGVLYMKSVIQVIIHVHVYTHVSMRERETDRQINRRTDKQTEIEGRVMEGGRKINIKLVLL